MLLIVVLIIFSLILLGISIFFYIWWSKYGKKIFKMFMETRNNHKFGNKIPDYRELADHARMFNEFLSKKMKK